MYRNIRLLVSTIIAAIIVLGSLNISIVRAANVGKTYTLPLSVSDAEELVREYFNARDPYIRPFEPRNKTNTVVSFDLRSQYPDQQSANILQGMIAVDLLTGKAEIEWMWETTLEIVYLLPGSSINANQTTSGIPADAVTFNGYSYKLFDLGMNWTEAKAYCESLGGYLATVRSAEENRFLSSYVTSSSYSGAYLGGTDERTEGVWEWVTGERFDYTNWAPREPNNEFGREDYLLFHQSGTWNDIPNEKWPFICKWGPINTNGTPITPPTTIIASDWAKPEIVKAKTHDLIPDSLAGSNTDYTRPITRAEFAGVAVKVYENLTATKALPTVRNPFRDTSELDVLKAFNAGIMVGISASEFQPNTRLNREQCATALTRVFKRSTIPGWSIDFDSSFPLSFTRPATFADDSVISSWAKESVYFMAANRIISGIGNNLFAPRSTTSDEEARGYAQATREQALAIAVRMVENLR